MNSEPFVYDARNGGYPCFYCGRPAADTGILERKGIGAVRLEDE